MKRVFLLHPHAFYLDVIPHLIRHGIEPVLACVSEEKRGGLAAFQKMLPNCEVVSSFMMLAGEAMNHRSPVPASVVDLRALGDWEGTILQMIDRLNYDNMSVQEMRSVVLRYISMWNAAVDHHRPDAIIFHGTPHMGHDFILYQLAKVSRVKTVIVERTHLNERLYFRDELADVPSPTIGELETEASVKSESTRPVSCSLFEQRNQRINDVAEIKRQLSWRSLTLSICDPRRNSGWAHPKVSSENGLTQKRPWMIRHRWRKVRHQRQALTALRHYEGLSETPDLSENFVFYPLHFEPERTTVPDAGRLADQLNTIQRLAFCLPDGWKLYVKEHPRQFRRGVLWPKARTLDFYNRLAETPNVDVMSFTQPSSTLIENCRAVATITGSAGWEALQVGKPAVVFGNPWYASCPAVFRVDDLASLRSAFETIAQNDLVEGNLAEAFARVVADRYTFQGCFFDDLLASSQLTSEENGILYADAIARELLPCEAKVQNRQLAEAMVPRGGV